MKPKYLSATAFMAAASITASTASAQTIYRSGEVTMSDRETIDLDTGVVSAGPGGVAHDFEFRAIGPNGYLFPIGGVPLVWVDTLVITKDVCEAALEDVISWPLDLEVITGDRRYVCYRTSKGRVGSMRMNQTPSLLNRNLQIGYSVWASEDEESAPGYTRLSPEQSTEYRDPLVTPDMLGDEGSEPAAPSISADAMDPEVPGSFGPGLPGEQAEEETGFQAPDFLVADPVDPGTPLGESNEDAESGDLLAGVTAGDPYSDVTEVVTCPTLETVQSDEGILNATTDNGWDLSYTTDSLWGLPYFMGAEFKDNDTLVCSYWNISTHTMEVQQNINPFSLLFSPGLKPAYVSVMLQGGTYEYSQTLEGACAPVVTEQFDDEGVCRGNGRADRRFALHEPDYLQDIWSPAWFPFPISDTNPYESPQRCAISCTRQELLIPEAATN